MPVTPEMVNEAREDGCFAVTPQRKYYIRDQCFIKRSLPPEEWQTSAFNGRTHVPRFNHDRARNEAAAMRFVAENTNIPVPKLHCTFEDRRAVYIVMEYVEGVGMDSLSDTERETVVQELLGHLETLRTLRRRAPGGVSGIVIPPPRAWPKLPRERWTLREADEDLAFCHGDLSMPNIIVDPATLKIAAIIDWECAGFWPESFEMPCYTRHGGSYPLEGEKDDSQEIADFLEAHRAG